MSPARGSGSQPEKALALARVATGLVPESPNYRNTLGVACYRLGRWREAAAALESNVGYNPDRAAWDLYFLAGCYHHLGDAARRASGSTAPPAGRRRTRPGCPRRCATSCAAFRAEAEEALRGPPNSALQRREDP